MKKPRVLVGRISGLRVPAAGLAAKVGPRRGAVVNFASGGAAELDPGHPAADLFASVLGQARSAALPVYAEVDPDTKKITDLQIALEGNVSSINVDAAGNAEIEVEISHAIHVLRKDNPNFKRLLTAAQKAFEKGQPVTLTERNADGIIDIRPAPRGRGKPAAKEAPPFEHVPAEALAAAAAVTPARAKQLFDMCKSKSCAPKTAPPPCIPFLYPDDGCWGRASEMCRLIIASGVQPAKIWIYGRLQVSTRNNPSCMVRWGWHVTATLQVQVGRNVQTQAIDPSLFNAPVTVAQWKSVQGDAGAQLAPTAANVFYRDRNGNVSYDPNYAQTNKVLDTYRLQLRLRSASAAGPPPYRNCR
jgi:Glutaminase